MCTYPSIGHMGLFFMALTIWGAVDGYPGFGCYADSGRVNSSGMAILKWPSNRGGWGAGLLTYCCLCFYILLMCLQTHDTYPHLYQDSFGFEHNYNDFQPRSHFSFHGSGLLIFVHIFYDIKSPCCLLPFSFCNPSERKLPFSEETLELQKCWISLLKWSVCIINSSPSLVYDLLNMFLVCYSGPTFKRYIFRH